MIQYVNYMILGLVQGVTEFLPISSDGHLVLLRRWIDTPGDGITVVVLLHAGSLAALLWAFRRDLAGLLRPSRDPSVLGGPVLLGLIAVSTLPVVIVGPAFYSLFYAAFESAELAAWMLIVTGSVLVATRSLRVGNASVSLLSAVAMGVAQVFALLPGLSRSALTMAAGFALGVERVRAARFSFLMAVPAIIGANVYELSKLGEVRDLEPVGLAIGIGAAFLSGLVAIRVLLFLVRRGRFEWFGVYCLIVGLWFLLGG